MLSERASRRQGIHQVKNRAEVSGSGKKPKTKKQVELVIVQHVHQFEWVVVEHSIIKQTRTIH
ncbi:hypothetical protein NW739_01175 [Mycoplasmopsis felis]|nr:hypothetical protein [Mycoplasmopsis felis]MCU9939426.1 hypothetical protein [Mycoplasmopsis felis]